METIKVYKNGNKELRIYQDDNSDNPRNWDNLGTIAYRHRRLQLGEIELPNDLNAEDCEQWLKDKHNALLIIPLYAYEHTGISLSISREYPYNCRWDSGQVGFIFVTEQALKNDNLDIKNDYEKIITILKGEIETFNKFLNGEVYGFELIEYQKELIKCPNCNTEHETGHINEIHKDSCWGFYDDKGDYGLNQMLEQIGETQETFITNWKEV